LCDILFKIYKKERGDLMKQQLVLFESKNPEDKFRHDIGAGLGLEISEDEKPKVKLYRNDDFIKGADFSDRVAKRLFIVEIIELGAIQNRVAKVLNMSRQTIHNYLACKEHFGLEGLIHGYTPDASRSLRTQRERHSEKRPQGNKAEQVAEIRRKIKEEKEKKQLHFNFTLPENEIEQKVEEQEQPFCEEHEWEQTRYAGIFTYLIAMISEWKWLELLMNCFGAGYKIFMVFLLMGARNIRSIEQLKNIRNREAGIVLGMGKVPAKPKIWQWFYSVARKKLAKILLMNYFRYQICVGTVGIDVWFTDGHLLPYTGKEHVHFSYNTQRRMPVPGQTSLVTCDSSGRVVDFEIQEGKGDLRGHIVTLWHKWAEDLPARPVNVFDREGNGTEFFSGLVKEKIPFVTWEKNSDSEKLASIEQEKFTEAFEFNDKQYSVFEEDKSFTYIPDEPHGEKHSFTLRRIYLWNKSSRRRTCGLANIDKKQMSTTDCARIILSRWGASENTFKHQKERHPLHYHPGFELVESQRQEITNPEIKEKQDLIARIKKGLDKLYKKLIKTREVLTKEGTPRKNSVRERVKKSIQEEESKLECLKVEKSELPEKVDVSTLENYKSFKRIDNEGKYLFDFVTTSVWNARKQMVEWLRTFFNQDNEVVDLFYAITNCHGWIKSTKNEVIVRLEPLQQPKRRMAQEQLCRKLTNLGAKTPRGKWLMIEVGESPL
jgi:hypothetical protein